jgi:hypothetical protein
VEHLVLDFKHDIRDVIPYSNFIQEIRPVLSETRTGEYLGDDMAIDGGDAEAVFSSADARALFTLLEPRLKMLPFMRAARVTLVFGELDSGAESCQLTIGQ